MDFDYDQAVDHVLGVVGTAENVTAGVSALVEYCESARAAGTAVPRLPPIDYAADAAAMAQVLDRLVSGGTVPADCTGLYFRLDGLHEPGSLGIQVGCSPNFDPGIPGMRWVNQCSVVAGYLPSAALRTLYGAGVATNSLTNYVVCIGYIGLALRQALEKIPPARLLVGAPNRAAAWGFYFEFLATLGVARPDGFERHVGRDPDPDATAAYTPMPQPGTSLGQYYEMRPSYNRRQWLLEADDAAGIHVWDLLPPLLPQLAAAGRPIPLRVKQHGWRGGLSTLAMSSGLLVADASTARLLAGLAPGDLELLPARVAGSDDEYFVVNPKFRVHAEAVLQHEHIVLVVDSSSAGDHQVFRATHCTFPVVAAGVKNGIEAAGVRTRCFRPVLCRR